MPKETFFNLPEDKRQRVLEEAVQEFAAHTYHHASLSQIVERSGIAKGSIYQYFEDKFDLYIHVLTQALTTRMEFIEMAIASQGPCPDIFSTLEASFIGSLTLFRENPHFAAIASNLVLETDQRIYHRVRVELGSIGESTLRQWLAQARDRGQLKKDMNLDAATYMIAALMRSIDEDLARGQLSTEGVEDFLDHILQALKTGLAAVDGPS